METDLPPPSPPSDAAGDGSIPEDLPPPGPLGALDLGGPLAPPFAYAMDPSPSPLDSANAVLIPDDENELYELDAQAASAAAPPIAAVSASDARSESLHRTQTSHGEYFIPRDDGNEPGDLTLALERAEQLLARTQMAEHDPEGAVPDFWCPAERFSALGTGITLYFRQLSGLVQVFVLVALLATAICLVHIAVALMPSTQGLDERSADLLGLSRLAIPTLATELMALPPPATVLEPVFNGGVDIRTVNLFFSAADALLTAVLLAYVLLIRWTFKRAAHRADSEVCSLTDYAVCVHGLPPDATARELRKYCEDALGVDAGAVAEVTVLKPCRDVLRLNRQREAHEKRLRRKAAAAARASASASASAPARASASASASAPASPAPAATSPSAAASPSAATPTRVAQQVLKVSSVVEAMRARAYRASRRATQAFVVFENESDVYRALRALPRSELLRGLLQRRSARFRGKHALSAEPAPDPSNVIWENLEYDLPARAVRKGVVLSLLLAMLCASAAFIFYARSQQPPSSLDCAPSEALGYLRCGDVFGIDVLTDRANTTLTQRALLQGYWAGSGGKEMLDSCLQDERYIGFRGGRNVWRPGPGAMPDANISSLAPYLPIDNFAPFSRADNCSAVACYSCYCEKIGFKEYYTNKDGHKGFCGDYWEAIGMKTIIRLGIVVVVLAINFSLNVVIRRLSVFERAHTLSNQEATLTIKLAIAQFVNMALVTLAVYAYVEELKGFYDDLGLRTFEWATDFSYRLYQQVGASIVLTLCASAATKPLQGYFSHWWHFMWRQSKVTRRAVPVRGASATRFVRKTVLRKRYAKLSQNECDRIFIGPRFLLSERFGEILSMWLACLIFSSGMPFMYVVFFMYIALQVLMDRVLLLRVCRRPAQYDDKLGIQFLKYLPIGLLLKTAFGFWMFSGLLASYTIGGHLSGYVDITDGASDDFQGRVLKVNGFIQFLAFLLVLLVLVVRLNWSFIIVCIRTCLGPNSCCLTDDADFEGNPPFSVARRSGALQGVHDTYNPIHCCYSHRVLNSHHPEIGAMLYDSVLALNNPEPSMLVREDSDAVPAEQQAQRGGGRPRASRRKSTISTAVPVDDRW